MRSRICAPDTDHVTVEAGKRYQWSVYVGVHRCIDVDIGGAWFDSTSTVIGWMPATLTVVGKAGGNRLDGYERVCAFGVAPAGACAFRPFVSIRPSGGSDLDCWLFFVQPMFAEALPNQTVPSPWVQGGQTVVHGDWIKTGTVQLNALAFTPVSSTDVVAKINASSEGIRIAANKLYIDGNVSTAAAGTILPRRSPVVAQQQT